MSSSQEHSLFGNYTSGHASLREQSGSLWLYTNRSNLLEFLSSGLIKPSVGFEKYYQDLLELRPGYIPLFTHIPGSDTARFGSDNEGLFPVALEIDPRRLRQANRPSLNFGSEHAVQNEKNSDSACVAYEGVIPLPAVCAVHFPSERELREHTARLYENVPLDALELTVSPHLFTGDGVGLSTVSSWLKTINEPTFPTISEFLLCSRFAGAITLLTAHIPRGEIAFDAVTALVTSETSCRIEGKLEWLISLLNRFILTGVQSGLESNDPDEVLLAAAVDAILSSPFDGCDSISLAASIRNRVSKTSLSESGRTVILRYLKHIEEILDGMAAVDRFKPGGLASGKGLVLFLLRPEPKGIDSWKTDPIEPDQLSIQIAATLSGMRKGRSRLPLQYRPQNLERLMSFWEARYLNQNLPRPPIEDIEFIRTEHTIERTNERRISLLDHTDHTIYSLVLPRTIRGIFASADNFRARAFNRTARRLIETMNWDDCAYMRVEAHPEPPKESHGARATVFRGLPKYRIHIDYKCLAKRLKETSIPPALEEELLGFFEDSKNS